MSPSSPVALDLRDHVDFRQAGPVTAHVAGGAQLTLSVVCLEPGQVLPATVATCDVLLMVVGGRAWVVVDDAEVVLTALQAVLVPEGAAHGLRNDSADPLILQVVEAVGQVRGDLADAGATVGPPSPAPPVSPVPPVSPGPPPTSGPDTGAPPRLGRLRRLLGSG